MKRSAKIVVNALVKYQCYLGTKEEEIIFAMELAESPFTICLWSPDTEWMFREPLHNCEKIKIFY